MEQIETQVSDLRYLSQATTTAEAGAAGSPTSSSDHRGAAADHRRRAAHFDYSHLARPSLSSDPPSAVRGPPLTRGSAPGQGKTSQAGTPNTAAGIASPVGSTSAADVSAFGYGESHVSLHSKRGASRHGSSSYAAGPLDEMADEDVGEMSMLSPSGKRKTADDSGSAKQTRSKRNRYISIACNECKRRKIKCNGETPCLRCGNLNLACLYTPNCCAGSSFKDTAEYRQLNDRLAHLQDEVTRLSSTVRSIQSSSSSAAASYPALPANTLSPITNDRLPGIASASGTSPAQQSTPQSVHPVLPRPNHPSYHHHHHQQQQQQHHPHPPYHHSTDGSFRGATSTAFSLNIANNTISNMGYEAINEASVVDDTATRQVDESALAAIQIALPPISEAQRDPLLDFDKDEMIRLCRLHEEEVGIMYPVLDVQSVIAHAKDLVPLLNAMRQQRSVQPINDDKSLRLKMIMCCALAVEEHGNSTTAARLYSSMEDVINRKLMSDASDVANLPVLALTAGYRFLSNEEILAWRVLGHVVRLCLELGLHQKKGICKIQDAEERRNTLLSFWSVYVLDRRWAFGTGLPYSVQDDEIDPKIPMPEEYPYLMAMIVLSRISAKVWREVSHFGPVLAQEMQKEDIERLDQEILQWYETVPDQVKLRDWNKEPIVTSTPSYNWQRLKIWTYLRFNQIRIWLYIPILHSATSIMSNPGQAQVVVDLAKDTIRFLSHLNNTTNLYRTIQVFYHQFLASAIAVLFLASVHQPVRFSAMCREEFYLALDLVKDLSAKSWVSQRLWRTIRGLKDIAPRFGLNPDDDRHSFAALGTMGSIKAAPKSSPASSSSINASYQKNGHHHHHHYHDELPPVERAGSVSSTHHTQPRSSQSHSVAAQGDGNGLQLQSEMSRMFEGYVGLNGFQYGGAPEGDMPSHQLPSPDSTGIYGGEGGLFSQFKEMF